MINSEHLCRVSIHTNNLRRIWSAQAVTSTPWGGFLHSRDVKTWKGRGNIVFQESQQTHIIYLLAFGDPWSHESLPFCTHYTLKEYWLFSGPRTNAPTTLEWCGSTRFQTCRRRMKRWHGKLEKENVDHIIRQTKRTAC